MVSKKIAVIGTYDTILPFRAIGTDGIEATNADQAFEKLDEALRKHEYGIIYIEEVYADKYQEEIRKMNEKYHDVSITAVAGSKGGTGKSVEKIRNYVKRAIGIDIFAEKGGS